MGDLIAFPPPSSSSAAVERARERWRTTEHHRSLVHPAPDPNTVSVVLIPDSGWVGCGCGHVATGASPKEMLTLMVEHKTYDCPLRAR